MLMQSISDDKETGEPPGTDLSSRRASESSSSSSVNYTCDSESDSTDSEEEAKDLFLPYPSQYNHKLLTYPVPHPNLSTDSSKLLTYPHLYPFPMFHPPSPLPKKRKFDESSLSVTECMMLSIKSQHPDK